MEKACPDATAQEVRDLQVLLDVARAMAVVTDHDELLALILNSARQVLDAERTTLFLYEPATNELVSKIAHGTGEIRFPATAGIAGAVAQGRKLINIPDAYADERFNRDIDRQTGYVTRCLLTVPLVGSDEQLVGVMQVLNKKGGPFTAYDERLAEGLAAQVGVALQRGRLMRHYLEKKQLESALSLARSIQQSLLPRAAPVVPGYDLAGWNQPADQMGGDCYDFIPLTGGRLALNVADAAGHGVGAALVITEMRALLRAFSEEVARPADVLVRANHWLCADLLESMFVTVFFAILDPARHVLEHASAGHGPLFWYRAATREVTSTGADGLPLGMFDPLMLEPVPPVVFAPGDLAVLLTDGFVEAESPQGSSFGKESVSRIIRDNAGASAAEIIRALAEGAKGFLGGGPQMDDLTAVVVKRRLE